MRNIRAKFGISNFPQSPDMGQNPDEGISGSRIYGQSFVNGDCHNSRISHDIDIKLGPVTEIRKKITAPSKKICQ